VEAEYMISLKSITASSQSVSS